MGILILLLCSLPPLAILVVAAIHGFRTRDAGIASTLAVSATILAISLLIPLADKPEQVASFRFSAPEANGIAMNSAGDSPIRLTRRWDRDGVNWERAQEQVE